MTRLLLALVCCIAGTGSLSHAKPHSTNFVHERRKHESRHRMSMIQELLPRTASYDDEDKEDMPSRKRSKHHETRAKEKLQKRKASKSDGSTTSTSKDAAKQKQSKSKSKSSQKSYNPPTSLSPVFYTTVPPQGSIPTFPPFDRPRPSGNETESEEEKEEEEEKHTPSPVPEDEESSSSGPSSSRSKGKMKMGGGGDMKMTGMGGSSKTSSSTSQKSKKMKTMSGSKMNKKMNNKMSSKTRNGGSTGHPTFLKPTGPEPTVKPTLPFGEMTAQPTAKMALQTEEPTEGNATAISTIPPTIVTTGEATAGGPVVFTLSPTITTTAIDPNESNGTIMEAPGGKNNDTETTMGPTNNGTSTIAPIDNNNSTTNNTSITLSPTTILRAPKKEDLESLQHNSMEEPKDNATTSYMMEAPTVYWSMDTTTDDDNMTVAMMARSAPIMKRAQNVPDETVEPDVDYENEQWILVGTPLQGRATVRDRFGYKVSLSSDAGMLAVSTGMGSPMYVYKLDTSSSEDDQWMPVDLSGIESDGILTLSGDGSTLAVKTRTQVLMYKRIEQGDGTVQWIRLGSALEKIDTDMSTTTMMVVKDLSAIPSRFGEAVALSHDGRTVAIGDQADKNMTGWAQVYTFDGNQWGPLGAESFVGFENGDHFGSSLALSRDGRTLAVCGTQNSYIDGPGYCQIHRYSDAHTSWIQLGLDISGQGQLDSFGRSVALSSDGNTLAVSADGRDVGNLKDVGRVYTFAYDPNDKYWPRLGRMINGDEENQRLGHSIDLSSDGTMLVVGAWAQGHPLEGYAAVYQLQTTTTAEAESREEWVQVGQLLTNGNNFDNFGGSVSMSSDGTTVAVGAYNFGVTALEFIGQATVFTLSQ
ncbi:Membrane [Seminavis robusta]|uniref:Membrane n=1 Tax=Seminavis robusta TaxID=568900 RepID=A0A9N8DM80_9STRA|nr:Membrane [Seminavis robusta]|eukprot:Sro210_g087620.1 Membrane (867) ;mRNA; f:39643-42243